MDEMDLTQELVLVRQEAALAAIRRESELARTTKIPERPKECEECGCEIPLARLRVAPRAMTCVECAEEREKRKRLGRF
jgi:RNA polymerase-binding transcription factor DksA